MPTRVIQVAISQLPGASDIPLPRYQTAGAAAMDVHAAISEPLLLSPGDIHLVATGFSIAVPKGFEAQLRPRSGLAANHGITLINAPATIDSDYRGEVLVALAHFGKAPYLLHRGDRVAQLLLCAIPRIAWRRVRHLPTTARGPRGLGHTGTH